jgi:hypothetical protein
MYGWRARIGNISPTAWKNVLDLCFFDFDNAMIFFYSEVTFRNKQMTKACHIF